MSETKKYRVTGLVTISVSTVIEATSAKAAKKEALKQPMMSLCYQCSHGEDASEWVTSGELDGEVFDLRCDEAEEVE